MALLYVCIHRKFSTMTLIFWVLYVVLLIRRKAGCIGVKIGEVSEIHRLKSMGTISSIAVCQSVGWFLSGIDHCVSQCALQFILSIVFADIMC